MIIHFSIQCQRPSAHSLIGHIRSANSETPNHSLQSVRGHEDHPSLLKLRVPEEVGMDR